MESVAANRNTFPDEKYGGKRCCIFMKNSITLKIAKSLCAVFLVMTMFICHSPLAVYAEELYAEEITEETTTEETTAETTTEETTTEETTAEESTQAALNPAAEGDVPENSVDPDDQQPYRYKLNIEYGSLSFYYDWGSWDPESCLYKADGASQYPANGTTDRMPGWYGFDGTANRISFVNESMASDTLYVLFEYHQRPFNTSEEFPPIAPPTVTYYSDQTLQTPCASVDSEYSIFEVPYSKTDDTIVPTNVYVSFEGAPYYVEYVVGDHVYYGDRYHTDTPTQIGFLTVTVGLTEDSLKPAVNAQLWDDPDEPESELIVETAESLEETTIVSTESKEETTEETTAEETTEEPIQSMARD